MVEPGSRAYRPPKKKLTRRRRDAEDVREVLKISLRSLRSLRLKIWRASLAIQKGFRLRQRELGGALSIVAVSFSRALRWRTTRKRVFDDIYLFVFLFPWVKTHGY